jgi:hypothetical protein
VSNGELLRRAELEFDVLVTTDTNLPDQQHLAQYDLAFVILRAYRIRYPDLALLVPEILDRIADLRPGEVVFIGSPLPGSDEGSEAPSGA